MAENFKQKLLFTTLTLTLLMISSFYAAVAPKTQAAEMTTRQKGLAALNSLVDLDLAKYAVTTEENSQYTRSLGTVFEETVLYDLTSATSRLKAFCTFADGNLQEIYVFAREGTPSFTKPVVSVNDVERAQVFLSNHQAYAAKPVFGELKSTLNNVDAGKNVTKTFGDKVLQVTAYDDCTLFKWYYTANGATAPYTKFISMIFKDGLLTSFIDNWNLYSIGSTSVNLSKDEAVAIALDAARKHTWPMQLDEDALDARNFNEKRSVPWTVLTFDGSLDANNIRSGNILELYPVWRVGLVLNKEYGELYGIEVDIWADTKEVRSVKEEYSQLVAQLSENTTAGVGTSAAVVNGVEPNFVIGTMLSATTVGSIGAAAAGLFKKNPKALSRLKPCFLKTWGILLGFLMLLAVFSPLIATANATTRAGNIWGSRSTGAPGTPPHHSWRKTDSEILKQAYAASYIAGSCFKAANGYTGYNNIATNKDTIISQAGYFRDNYDYVAIVDFDHGVGGYPGQAPGYPNVPSNEEHYMFEDDWGTVVGSPLGSSDWSHGVYDIDIYNTFPPAKVHFAFIDACQSADLYRLGQGFYSGTGNPVGLPFAFTHRQVSWPFSGTQMSAEGYNYPDSFPQCYIGFPFGSAALDQKINYNQQYGTGPYWYDWVTKFFYRALNFDVSVKEALDYASTNVGWTGCTSFANSPLVGSGFAAVWPMDKYAPWGQYEDYVGYYSTLAVYGNSNIHLKNFQPSDIVTVPVVSGPTVGYASTSYQFSTSSIDSYGHNIKYRFDWGDGSPYTETGWYSNGATASASHSWSSNGLYSVRVQARCSNGNWGSWSNLHYMNIGYLTAQLTVYAYNQYGYPGYVPLYIDDEYVGTTGSAYSVLLGIRQVYVESPLYDGYYHHVFDHYVSGGYSYYVNPMSGLFAGDATVTAYYYTY